MYCLEIQFLKLEKAENFFWITALLGHDKVNWQRFSSNWPVTYDFGGYVSDILLPRYQVHFFKRKVRLKISL